MHDGVKLAWGKHESGKPLHVNEAKNGKACDCICYECGTQLIAVQGQSGKRRWHFSHASKIHCSGMSALHFVAQNVFIDSMGEGFTLPKFEVSECEEIEGIEFKYHKQLPESQLIIASAVLEKKYNDQFVDVSVEDAKGNVVIIEIAVTNFKNELNKISLLELDLPVVEIDLGDMAWDSTYQEIREAVLTGVRNKYFIAHPIYNERNNFFDLLRETQPQQRLEEIEKFSQREHFVEYHYHTEFKENMLSEQNLHKTVCISISAAKTAVSHETEFSWYETAIDKNIPIRVYFGLMHHYFDDIDCGTSSVQIQTPDYSGPALFFIDRHLSQYHWANVQHWDKKAHKELEREYQKLLEARMAEQAEHKKKFPFLY